MRFKRHEFEDAATQLCLLQKGVFKINDRSLLKGFKSDYSHEYNPQLADTQKKLIVDKVLR
ncbi:MAG: hypothetical protein JWQ63_877 [Mucilaginibacter sp.]|jgi:hypothetical protein|nr:hypothetical protein [Mucilaginibacter sp.]